MSVTPRLKAKRALLPQVPPRTPTAPRVLPEEEAKTTLSKAGKKKLKKKEKQASGGGAKP